MSRGIVIERGLGTGARRALAALGLIAVLLSGAPAAAQPQCAFALPEEAQALARRAAAFLARAGPVDAFPRFMDPGGGFFDRDLYVFVIDTSGRILVNGGFPELVGSDASGARDSRGRLFVQEMLRVTNEGGEGWVRYEWYNPCTGKLGRKVSYVKRVGRFIVGVGAYGTVGV
jgi:cytochrome c